jgi:putative addiction module killer protein
MIEIRRTAAFINWLRDLRDRRAQEIITQRITRLAGGLFGDVKSVGDGVSEMRINYGPGYRIYFTRQGNVVVVLLCGGDKDSQARDIARAKLMAADLED